MTGIILILLRWPLIGFLVELYGIFVLFGDFFATVASFAGNIPVLGPYIQQLLNWVGSARRNADLPVWTPKGVPTKDAVQGRTPWEDMFETWARPINSCRIIPCDQGPDSVKRADSRIPLGLVQDEKQRTKWFTLTYRVVFVSSIYQFPLPRGMQIKYTFWSVLKPTSQMLSSLHRSDNRQVAQPYLRPSRVELSLDNAWREWPAVFWQSPHLPFPIEI